MEVTKINREQYMKFPSELHHDYYMQFVTPSMYKFVSTNYTIDFLVKCYNEDENLNNLGNGWMDKFDYYTYLFRRDFCRVNKELNGSFSFSLCDGTCAIKACMRDTIINQQGGNYDRF